MNNYVIYMHLTKNDNTPFYIGKGKINRANSKKGRSDWWNRIVDKYGYNIDIIESNLTEEEAFEREKYWIDRIGRRDLGNGPLVNMTDGGEGFSGNHTEETKQKISKNNARGFKGKKHSNESKKKMSISQKGRPGYWTGKKRSEEMINIISNTHKGNTYRLGKNHSKETKEKISNSKTNKGIKKVQKLTLDGVLVYTYNSLKEAAFLNNTNYQSIYRVSKGERNQHLGFKWHIID